MSVKGYKVFNPDWTCRNFQYQVGQTYKMEGPVTLKDPVTLCEHGFIFCKNAADCFNYYSFDSRNKVAEVIAHGTVEEELDRCCTDMIEIVREISWQEVLTLVNTGNNCTGNRNTGNYNTGNWNTGSWNAGNRNIGNWNTGDWNTGDWNIGNWNTGSGNIGNCNIGDWNRTSFSNGCFNTVEPKIYMFNKPSDWTYRDWASSRACKLIWEIDNYPLEYVWYGDMTAEEKVAHPEAETTGGYLKERTTVGDARKWWADMDTTDRNEILNLPNFDAEVFREITGVDVTK